MDKISAEGYRAFGDALAKIYWRKPVFERYVRLVLRDHPELLAGLPFGETKRTVCDELVARLSAAETRYHDFTLSLMVQVSQISEFPDLAVQHDKPELIPAAEAAVAYLARLTQPHQERMSGAEKIRVEAEERRQAALAVAMFDAERDALKQRFLELTTSRDPHGRGKAYERLLGDLFTLYDLEPRLSYNRDMDQIDGSFSFDTDDYVVEAKWLAGPAEKIAADGFMAKIVRLGKNGLGLFVSANGFSAGFKQVYAWGTSFITMDNHDLYLILDGRVRLDDVLRAKKRHANETGSCYFSAQQLG